MEDPNYPDRFQPNDPGKYDPTQPEGRPLGVPILALLVALAIMGIGWLVIAYVVS
jgi:hypothetical protein